MAEIATGFASNVASEALKKATETLYGFISYRISYVFKYQSYLEEPKQQAKQLGRRREDVEADVNVAERQGEEIYNEVTDWLRGVEVFMGRVAKLVDDEDKVKRRCFKGLCPDVIKRYRLSKEAEKVAEDGAKLLGKGNFSRVSHPVFLQRTASVYIEDYEAFDSRVSVLQEIMEALKDANVNKVGVYGMAGVGKTTLVKKVAWQAKEGKLFDEVVMTTVTQTPDFKKIQEEIADQLGLKFLEQTVSGRSLRLRDRLKREKRILVILDDIWAKLDLDAVGIPHGDIHEGISQEKEVWKDRKDDERRYKILLTSRVEYVLRNHMNIQKNFLVDLLSDEEAWYLFQKVVGDSVENSDFRRIAVEVVRKCARLPIAIETVATALKSKSLPVWEDALGQLTRSNPRQIEGMAESVCSIIELSYNFLKSEEKSLLLLCGLLNASRGIVISDLLKYSMGLHLFRDVYTLEDGRNRLLTLIHNLKASSLLLDSITNYSVKMHDIIHAIVISIASSEEFMFSIKNIGELKDVLEEKIPKTSTAITLPYGDIGDELPQSLEYPKLKFFYLLSQNHSLQIPDLLFQGMQELEVLDLTRIRLLSLPSSLRCLKNLQTLCLHGCLLEDIAIVGELKKLKILSLVDADIEKLPREIGQLTRLKMLDLRECSNLKVIPPNVISSLSRLEELYMGNSFLHWETEGLMNDQERENANVLELKQLSCLTTLEIHVRDLQMIPQDLFSEKLKRYRILIGDVWDWSWYATYGETSRMLKIKLNDSISLIHRVKILLKRTEELHLELNGVKNAIDELDEDGFAQLKHLQVQNGHELLYVVNAVPSKTVFPMLESLFLHKLKKLEKICDGELYAESFGNLRILKVEKCNMLEHLFSFSEHKKFLQLQEIEVIDCKNLKDLFGEERVEIVVENERNTKFEFTQLRSLVLQCLPQFIAFGMKVVLPRLENLKLSSINIEDIWLEQPMSSSFQCLKSLTVEECNGLTFLFSSSMVKSFMQLQNLVICNCKSMEVVILDSEGLEVQDKIIDMSFPKLFYLKLAGLPRLTRFGIGNSIEFPTLIELHIESCANLKTFFPNFSSVDMLRNKPEEVSLEDYIIDLNPLFDEKVACPSLEKMTLSHLDNLQLIWHNQLHGDSFCKLNIVRVEFCEKLMTIVPSNSTQPLLTFHNLEILIVEECWTMKSLFPVSIANDLLQLKLLMITSCGFEEIVAKEEVDEPLRFSFPQLATLKFANLPDLKHFYLGLHTIEWPMLKKLVAYHCGQPPLFSFEKVIPNLPNLDELGLDADSFTSGCLDRISARSVWKLKSLGLFKCDNESIASLYGFLQKLYNLETLYLGHSTLQELFPREGYIWKQDSQVGTFLQNLEILLIRRCHRLTYLMSSLAARTLVHLQTIIITDCKLLTEVIATEVETTEKEIVFSQLKSLELHCLPSLKSFCSTNYAFEFPCLEEVIVIQCPNLKIFSQGGLNTPKLKRVQLTEKIDEEYLWNNDLNSTIHQMFINMVGFPNLEQLKHLEHLKLSEFPTLEERFWNAEVPASLFYSLKLLVLDRFLETLSAIPFNVLCNLRNLETLEIRSCDSLKEVFDMEGSCAGHTLKKSHQEVLDFNNLKSFKVHNCCSLRHIFTLSIILVLAQLKEMEVKNCALVEEIILNEEEKEADIEKIMIPQLNSIILESLPNLTSFYSGINILECPTLKAIIVAKCPKIETFIFTDMKHQSDHIAPLFSEKVAFPSLEKMILLHLDNLQLIWHNQLYGDSFSKLKELRVEFCEKLMTIFPSNSTQEFLTFYNLEILDVQNCWNMKSMFPVSIAASLLQLKVFKIFSCGLEEIVANEEVDEAPKFLFPQLATLHLLFLPEVKHFYPGWHTIDCPMLKSLMLYKCGTIKIFASEFSKVQNTDQESQPSIGLSEKGMPNLESLNLSFDAFRLICHNHFPLEGLKELSLAELDDESILFSYGFFKRLFRLEKLTLMGSISKELFPYGIDPWKEDSQVHSFLPNLRTLKVWSYYHLTHLWASSVSFTNLTTLDIRNCNVLVNIFTCSTVKSLAQLTEIRIRECELLREVIVGEFDQTEEEIVFCQLKTLEFHRLASLTCFCSANYAFQFPCLEQVIVSECPELKIFTQGSLSTPKLNEVQHTRIIEANVWKDNLNSTLQYIWETLQKPALVVFLEEGVVLLEEASSSGTGVSS